MDIPVPYTNYYIYGSTDTTSSTISNYAYAWNLW
jgi:hypothetical protein